MSDKDLDLSFDDFDEINSPRPEENDFDAIVEAAISRRGFLGGTLALSSVAFLTSILPSSSAHAKTSSRFSFEAVKTNTLDTVTVPKGYNWHTVMKWGDPLWSKGSEFDHKTKGTPESQSLAMGDNNDGMAIFEIEGKTVLAVNNEYLNIRIMYDNKLPKTEDEILKGKAAHGVTICELSENNGKWSIVKDSSYNRRITADTPMEITGPARGHDFVKTKADPEGIQSLGTFNNCGNGETLWGTYLTCEENFNSYFSGSDKDYKTSPEMDRYGIKHRDRGYGWGKFDERFDISKNPNECNRAGYIVEIDPRDPKSTPKKRTALGRFKHENAEVVLAASGQVVVYMGDDERGEYLYKYMSDSIYTPGKPNPDLLEKGTLYAAKFNDDQTGVWLPLTPETTDMKSEAEICIYTRLAASAVNATTMDRPEWVAANPKKVEAYVSLTNNKNRGIKPNKGGDGTPVGGPNPRKGNVYGQIVRWTPDNSDHGSDKFKWDLFLLAGNPTVHKDAYAGSDNINEDNMFNAPDGLAFDSNGTLWIQTDGKYSNKGDFAGMGNNQMLVGDTATGEIKRFLVGPNEAEITGLSWSPDKKTMFVGIQHPGERGKGNSHFPDGGDTTPRSCVIAVRRDDGGVIG